MADSPAKKQWMKENAKIISFKAMRKSDADIIAYLETVPTATTIKAALREYMANHAPSATQPVAEKAKADMDELYEWLTKDDE